MESWGAWLCIKRSLLLPTKCIFLKFTTHLRRKAKGNRQGLVTLYKDMESCGEYADIQVMWEMLHSSSPANASKNNERKSANWRFCFRPT
ncbi:hypothetical protein CIPAW_10G160100 [Carya illinoinensis]|uniref:Uncharacterized protein n=1 Tax=Carya illinoinensis TaxID=32201 RepID=A0A8T1PC34_CARIL|nr:hypothetical protein CIPAW_10G160100 [Carya illinoinensis]KAG6693220.1 hypothetical protein I3842_10G157900 [Carya illinoinensis]